VLQDCNTSIHLTASSALHSYALSDSGLSCIHSGTQWRNYMIQCPRSNLYRADSRIFWLHRTGLQS
jgi:hypothetical protein